MANDYGGQPVRVTRQNVSYFEALELEKEGVRLLSHHDLDEYVCAWHGIMVPHLRGVWARELVAYLGYQETFAKGRDIEDPVSGLVLLAEYVPEEVTGVENIVLLVNPYSIEERRVIRPASVEVCHNLAYQWGQVDEKTRLPIGNVFFDPYDCESFIRNHARVRNISRSGGTNIRPLYRSTNDTVRTGGREHGFLIVQADKNPNKDKGLVAVEVRPGDEERIEEVLAEFDRTKRAQWRLSIAQRDYDRQGFFGKLFRGFRRPES